MSHLSSLQNISLRSFKDGTGCWFWYARSCHNLNASPVGLFDWAEMRSSKFVKWTRPSQSLKHREKYFTFCNQLKYRDKDKQNPTEQ